MLIKELFERGVLTNDELLELLMFIGFPKNRVTETQMNILKKALQFQPPLPKNIVLCRGLYPQEINEVRETKKLSSGRIMSFSSDERIAHSFMWQAQLKPPGSPYAQIIYVEFPAGSKNILNVISFIQSCPKEMIVKANQQVTKGYQDGQLDLMKIALEEKEYIVGPRNYQLVKTKENYPSSGPKSSETTIMRVI